MKFKYLFCLGAACFTLSSYLLKTILHLLLTKVEILYSRDGMPIWKELFLVINVGFTLLIQLRMMSKPLWMLFLQKIWCIGLSIPKS